MIYDGYGSVSEYLALGMDRAGCDVHITPILHDPAGLSQELEEMITQSRAKTTHPLVFFCWPVKSHLLRARRDLFMYTMWESDRLPGGWTTILNRCRAVLAPTRFVAQTMRDSGVSVPVEVVPLGVAPEVYKPLERPPRDIFTVLTVASMSERKNVFSGIAAFKRAFGDDPRVRLVIKSRYGDSNPEAIDDPRIRLVDANEPSRGIAHWYQQADVLLALGNEGFGLPAVEGMATALPVIALDGEGQGDLCEDARGLVLSVPPAQKVAFAPVQFGEAGTRSIPDEEVIRRHLLWVYRNREDARELGLAAADWVRSNRNIWRTGPQALHAVERHLSSRPLTKSPHVWIPDGRGDHGMDEYSRDLSASICNCRISTTPAYHSGVRVLSIQYHPDAFSHSQMHEALRKAKEQGISSQVTVHVVTDIPAPWMHEADLLISHTRGGAEWLLKQGFDNAEYLPYGCHIPHPRLGRKRGRTIGLFGRMIPHNGFLKVLRLLRDGLDADLFVISPQGDPECEATWEMEAEGLPVNRLMSIPRVRTVLDLLANHTDLLVFWRDQLPFYEASRAAHIGLSTGVPVLVSGCRSFQDIRDATWQADDLKTGITGLLENDKLRHQLIEAQRRYCMTHTWCNVARRQEALWRLIEPNQKGKRYAV